MKFHHYGIFTNSPGDLIDFYQDILGFKDGGQSVIDKDIAYQIFGINENLQLAKLTREDIRLEIFWPESSYKLEAGGNHIAGYNHFSIEVADKKEFSDEVLRKAEGKPFADKIKAIKVERGGHYIYFIKDSDGNLIEVRDRK